MKSRVGFLRDAASAGASLVISLGAGESTPSPKANVGAVAAKPPSPLARAQATAMRRFDTKLTDAELDTIARGIDAATAGPALSAGKDRLRNGDQPVTVFAAERS